MNNPTPALGQDTHGGCVDLSTPKSTTKGPRWGVGITGNLVKVTSAPGGTALRGLLWSCCRILGPTLPPPCRQLWLRGDVSGASMVAVTGGRPSQTLHDLSPPSACTQPLATQGLHTVPHSLKATPADGSPKEASDPLVGQWPVVRLVGGPWPPTPEAFSGLIAFSEGEAGLGGAGEGWARLRWGCRWDWAGLRRGCR